LLNVKTVKDMDTSKIIVTSNQDAPNEWAGDHLISQCHWKERSDDVPCVLCGGTSTCELQEAVYKGLEKQTYPPFRFKQYTPPAQIKCTLYT
jgi:hypothetical protein